MDTIAILKEAYGYNSPIILRRVRIGGKSKTAIRQDLSRAYKKGEINKIVNGVYYFGSGVTLVNEKYYLDMIEEKYIRNDYGYTNLDIDIYGYYTGDKFLEQVGIKKTHKNGVIEIVTNNTSSKRTLKHDDLVVVIRKSKVGVNKNNHKILQFLDMFYSLNNEEVKANKEIILSYFMNNLTVESVNEYLSYYPKRIKKTLMTLEIIKKLT